MSCNCNGLGPAALAEQSLPLTDKFNLSMCLIVRNVTKGHYCMLTKTTNMSLTHIPHT